LQAGTNVLTVTTTDAAGNTASASVSVTFDTTVPSPTPDPSPTPGLIGYWMLDEQTGTTAADSSGNGNAGTRVNGPVAVPGAVGAALSLNGVNQYVRVPHTAALDAYPLTVAAWVKFGSTTGRGGIVNKYVIGAYNGYQIFT